MLAFYDKNNLTFELVFYWIYYTKNYNAWQSLASYIFF